MADTIFDNGTLVTLGLVGLVAAVGAARKRHGSTGSMARDRYTDPRDATDWAAGYAAGLAAFHASPQRHVPGYAMSYDDAKKAWLAVGLQHGKTWLAGYRRGMERDRHPGWADGQEKREGTWT